MAASSSSRSPWLRLAAVAALVLLALATACDARTVKLSHADMRVVNAIRAERQAENAKPEELRVPVEQRFSALVDRAAALADLHEEHLVRVGVEMPSDAVETELQTSGGPDHGYDDTMKDWDSTRPTTPRFFFPSDCPTGERQCCPSFAGSECGGTSRGTCTNITTNDVTCDMTNGRASLWWFTNYFDYACVCEGNFYGVACEECAMGWEGDDCNTKSEVRYRRDFKTLSDIDKQYVIDAFRLAKTTPSPFQPNVSIYDFWAVLHRWSLPGGIDQTTLDLYGLTAQDWHFGHVGTGSLTWHRSMVNGVEKALQIATGNSTFSLPYWNWTYSAGNDNDDTLRWFGGDGSTTEPGYQQSCRDRTTSLDGGNFANCICPMARGPFAYWPIIGDWGYQVLDSTIARAFGCETLLAPSLPAQASSACVVSTHEYEVEIGSDGAVIESIEKAEGGAYMPETTSDASDLDTSKLRVALPPDEFREVRAQLITGETSDAGHSSDDEALWSRTSAPFHNLLGGGSQCRIARSWPNAYVPSDMHERAHRWLSGSLIYHHPASDPLFFMLHSYADLVLEQWIRNAQYHGRFGLFNSWYTAGGKSGHGRDECQGPYFPLRKHVSVFNSTLVNGVDWDFFEKYPTEMIPYVISEPTPQSSYFDGTDDYLVVDRSDLNNPTWRNETGEYYDYADESVSSFSPASVVTLTTSQKERIVTVDSSIVPPKNLRFLNTYACNSSTSCCPTSGAKELTCGGETRGTCSAVSSKVEELWWLTKYYTRVCVCNDNYAGVACETCKFGYEGDDCATKSEVRVRREFQTLGSDDRQYIIDAFRSAKVYPSRLQPGVSILDFYASVHFAQQWPVLAHEKVAKSSVELAEVISSGGGKGTLELASPLANGTGALTYYRALLLNLEQELQGMTANTSFSIPYWNWATGMENDNDEALRWFGGDGNSYGIIGGAGITGGNSDAGWTATSALCRRPTFSGRGGCTCPLERVFKAWTVPTLWAQTAVNVTVQRSFQCLGRIAPSLPTVELVDYALALDSYYSSNTSVDSFARYLTGLSAAGVKSWPAAEAPDMLTRVFNWIGGTSTTVDLADFRATVSNAAADPLFWLVTGYVDLLLERWLRLRADASDSTTLLPTAASSGVNSGEHVMGVIPLITNDQLFVNSTELGYTFDFFTSS